MTISEMLGQSGILTLLGLCVVFSFLIILICFMHFLHAIVHGLKLDKEDDVQKTSSASAVPSAVQSAVDEKAVVAAIAAAVHDKVLN